MGDFGLGVLQGFATSTDEALKTHIKDNKDRFNKNLEAALTRNLERSTRYDKKSREAQEALDLVGGLTGGDLGRASEVIQGIGGVGQTQGFVDKFRAAQFENPDLKLADVVQYAKEQQGTLTSQQAIDQILKPFTFTTPPSRPRREGLAGLFDDPRDMATEAKKEWLARGMTVREADNIIKRQGAQINWNKVATQDQRYAVREKALSFETKEIQRDAAKLAIDKATMGNQLLTEQVRAAPETARLNMEKLALDVQTGRLNYKNAMEFDRKTLEIGYAVQEATLLDKRSGTDYEQTLAKVDTQLMINSEKLEEMKVAGVDVNSKRYRTLQAKNDATLKHRATILKNGAQYLDDPKSLYGKINPVSWHKSTLRNNFTAAGIGYKTGLGPKVQRAYAQTFQQLYAASGDDPNMRGVIKTAFDQMMSNEQTVVQNKLAEYQRALADAKGQDTADVKEKAPKPLYVTKVVQKEIAGKLVDEKVFVSNPDGSKKINPKLKPGDLVTVNSGFDRNNRADNGYQSSVGVFMSPKPRGARERTPYIIGLRRPQDSILYQRIHGTYTAKQRQQYDRKN